MLHDSITFTRDLLKAMTIDNHNIATAILNQARLPEIVRRHRDAGASHAEHSRKKFLGQSEFITFDSILNQQKPARQPLIERVQTVTGCRLGHLGKHCVDKTKHEVA